MFRNQIFWCDKYWWPWLNLLFNYLPSRHPYCPWVCDCNFYRPPSMSTPFPRSSRRAKTPIHLPCKIPGCRRWFGNKAGLTQHINRFHPSFLTNPSASSPTSTSPNPAGPDNDEASYGDAYPYTGMEGDVVDSHWHGPGAKVYRNYHTKLTGK
jgi:hypothetical protein